MDNSTKQEWCLGHSCRFYKDPIDATCFKQGVFPNCSPEWKHARIKLDSAALEMYSFLKDLARAVDEGQERIGASRGIILGTILAKTTFIRM